jgi:hypothetical protein
MGPVSAWKFERQDTACKSSHHKEDELEDTIQPAVLVVSGQELACSLGSFWTRTSGLIVFLTGFSHGCKLEVISNTCLLFIYCAVQVLQVGSMSRFCFKLVILYVHMG